MNFIILLPIIINAIKAVEELLPNSPGKEKFDFVVQTLETVTGAAVDNLPALEKYVSVIVSMLKVLGIFKAKTPA